MELNNQIFYFFYGLAHQAEWLDKLIVFLAVYFPFVVVALAAWYLLFRRKSLRKFFFVFFSAGLAWIISEILKNLFHLPRPYDALTGIQPINQAMGYGFPSGHATAFMALAVAMFLVHKRAGWWFLFFTLLIGLARIAVGVHFPADILGGFALGALVAYFLKRV